MGSKASRRNRRNPEVELLLNHTLNHKATLEGPKRKKWNTHDLKNIKPLTPTQDEMFHAWFQGDNICAHGSAGTGKTFLALYLALLEILDTRAQSKIILIRSAVPTREIGHLPGTLEEKTALYELPYHDICWELVGRRSTYQDMKDAGLIEFMTTSFIRGLTWDNAIVIVDEGENMTFHEINSVMTRLGENSRVIFTGDIIQTDLDGRRNGTCGMKQFLDVIENMREFSSIKFSVGDIVRSEFVKAWITATQVAAA